jgi:hypothetical protein
MKRLLPTLLACTCLGLALCAAPAAADFGLKDLGVVFEEEDGSPATKAGSHPFAMTTTLGVNVKIIPEGAEDQETKELVDGEVPDGELEDLTVAQIPGLVGSQTAVPYCSEAEFVDRAFGYNKCPRESAVGYAAVKAEFTAYPAGTDAAWHIPLFNLEPNPGAAATFGFIPGNVPITFDVVVRPEPPYNLEVRLPDTPQALLFYRSEVTIWGNPADPAHDDLRGECVGSPIEPTPDPISNGSCPSSGEEVALLTLPRSCKGPLSTLFTATSWQDDFDEGTATTAEMQECDSLTFAADATATPTTDAASSPTGLDFKIEVDDPGLTDPEKTAQADISAVQVTLPEGLTANPSAAEGQGTCSVAQLDAASLGNPGCPENSKLGTATISSPLLNGSLKGSLYLATPRENPFNSLLATYLVIRDKKTGIFVSQAGEIKPNLVTGQLTTSFKDIPELPFSDLQVSFRQGPRAPIATPAACGTYTTKALFTPSSGGAPFASTSSFAITRGPNGQPCPQGTPFAPGFLAGTTDSAAGAYAPFYMRFTRADGEGQISALDATLPPGLVGRIAGLGRCSDQQISAARGRTGKAELASPSCPADSRIGSVLAGAGVGPALTQATGSLYLAGPFRGHPLSVVSVVPAVAGPFDLGNAVVRSALDLDPNTAQVRVIGADSDPIPTILEGIPLQVRDLRLFLDRPNFTLNATSCEPREIRSTLSAGALVANLTQRYQASNCGALGYKPKLTLKLLGATKRGKFPAVRSTLIPRVGDANSARAVVTLPPSQQIENAHINNPCTRVQFAAEACPPKSILGKAKAFSPLLDQPLEGNVYFRSNGGERELPDVVADLRGQFRIILVGFIDTKGKRIRTTFANIPDAPVSKFTLNLAGGKRGLLVNNRDICKGKQRAKLALTGQNGRRHVTNQVIGTSCKGGGKKGSSNKGKRR